MTLANGFGRRRGPHDGPGDGPAGAGAAGHPGRADEAAIGGADRGAPAPVARPASDPAQSGSGQVGPTGHPERYAPAVSPAGANSGNTFSGNAVADAATGIYLAAAANLD